LKDATLWNCNVFWKNVIFGYITNKTKYMSPSTDRRKKKMYSINKTYSEGSW